MYVLNMVAYHAAEDVDIYNACGALWFGTEASFRLSSAMTRMSRRLFSSTGFVRTLFTLRMSTCIKSQSKDVQRTDQHQLLNTLLGL